MRFSLGGLPDLSLALGGITLVGNSSLVISSSCISSVVEVEDVAVMTGECVSRVVVVMMGESVTELCLCLLSFATQAMASILGSGRRNTSRLVLCGVLVNLEEMWV